MNVVSGSSDCVIELIVKHEYSQWLTQQSEFVRQWLAHNDFSGEGFSLIPSKSGAIDKVLVVSDNIDSCWVLSDVAIALPQGRYSLGGSDELQTKAGLGWVLGQYRFDRYKAAAKAQATLCLESTAAVAAVERFSRAVFLTRDLVNTPANDMMPQHLSETMLQLAEEFGGRFSQIIGDDLLENNYPTIHMVGRASNHPPRLLDLRWGEVGRPKLTLVGKGVCFDTGGLDLKPSAGMRLMKKDMGGAAHVLGLASLIMSHNLPVQLRVLIPAVENAVNGDAFRPGDIVTTRKGLTVEIDNTDAEGRLVLCDALAEADADSETDLIIDFATLTGAARVALGLEVPGFYSTDDAFANQLMAASQNVEDEVWRLPLHQPYASLLKGSISDLVNATATPFGGSITAALYLQNFVEQAPWVHFDVGAWNDRPRPGRPKGGEAMGIRAVFAALEERYAKA